MPLASVSKSEWRWSGLWALVIMLITSLPYMYGLAASTPQQRFSGFILGVEDGNSYLAKMRMGGEGGWLSYLAYTPEPHPGAFVFTFHVLLGKIAGLLDLPAILVYHLARVIFGVGLLLTVYYFIAYFVEEVARRRFAFLLAALGGGLGWLIILMGLTPELGLPLDIYVPEGFIFLVLLNLPHLAVAESLLFLSIILVLQSWAEARWQPALSAGLTLLAMSAITPFYIAIHVAVLGSAWLVIFVVERSIRQSWNRLNKILLAVVVASPLLLYDAYLFTTDPIFKVFAAQNLILSPPIWHYLFAYGLLIIPALYGVLSFGPATQIVRNDRFLTLIIWCLIFPILVYIPFNLQRRLAVGVQVPLAVLATYGLFELGQKYITARRRRLAGAAALILFSLTNLFLLAGGLLAIRVRQPPVFQPGLQIEAMAWLADKTKGGEVVLATHATGNVLPVYASVRTFVGHGPETVYADQKLAQVDAFFGTAVNDTWRLDLLKHFEIDYVFFGPNEKAVGDFDPNLVPYLDEIYQNGAVTIFQVTSP